MEQPLHPVDALFARAKEAGVTMSDICDEANVAQSTPSRWKNDRESAERANLGVIRKLEDALSRIIEARREAA